MGDYGLLWENAGDEIEIGNLILTRDELRDLLGKIESALRETPGILDGMSKTEKDKFNKEGVRSLQRAGLLPARYH